MNKEKIIDIIKTLKQGDKRKFEQSVEIIVNLRAFDMKKDSVNLFLNLPHKIREAKIGAFLTTKSTLIDSIPKADFDKYKDKKKIKALIKEYDFFIAAASLMPTVAATFGRYLGPAGKMPSPQLGIIRTEDAKEIKETVEKFQKVVRVKSKEPSLKFCIGKENMKDEDIAENFLIAYNAVLNALPKKIENIRSVMLRLSMTKPIKIDLKGEK